MNIRETEDYFIVDIVFVGAGTMESVHAKAVGIVDVNTERPERLAKAYHTEALK